MGLISKSKEIKAWNIGSESQSSALYIGYYNPKISSDGNY
jgi:hypothetical protein